MSEKLVKYKLPPITPDEDWEEYEKEIASEDEDKKPWLKLGYGIGRYTDLEVDFVRKNGKNYMTTKQNVDISTLAKDIWDLWKNR